MFAVSAWGYSAGGVYYNCFLIDVLEHFLSFKITPPLSKLIKAFKKY